MKKGTLTLKKMSKLFKKADLVWQDQQNQDVFYVVDKREFYFKDKKPKSK